MGGRYQVYAKCNFIQVSFLIIFLRTKWSAAPLFIIPYRSVPLSVQKLPETNLNYGKQNHVNNETVKWKRDLYAKKTISGRKCK